MAKKQYSISDAERFKDEIIIQDKFFENEDDENEKDEVFINIKSYEKKILIELFHKNIPYLINNILKAKKIDLNIEKKLISEIIKNENAEMIYKNKIITEIEEIKKNPEKCKINYLTVLLVGRHKIGKKKLIKYMLDSKDKDPKIYTDEKKNFKIYKSQKEQYFQLIKYKGIGYEYNNDPEDITQKTVEYINQKKKEGNYNNFVHCIWYCICRERFEDVEINYLKKLKKVYPNECMTIIFVYLNGKINQGMKKIIEEDLGFDIKNDVVEVIPKPIKKTNNKITEARGNDVLKKLTINKINEALKGDMQILMLENFEKEIKKAIENKNTEIKK